MSSDEARPTLDPHQEVAVDWLLAHPRGGLADEMRVGKTGPTMVATARAGAARVLVLCPAHVRAVWREAMRTWGTGGAMWEIESYDRYANNARRRAELEAWAPDTLILDECHYLKTKGAKRTRAIYGTGCAGSPLLAAATRVWLLSGTPCPNGPHELWTHWRALFGEKRSYYQWVRHYCRIAHTDHGVKVLGIRKVALPELQATFRSRFIRRRFREVHGTDTLIWNVVPVSPNKVSREARTFLGSARHRELLDALQGATDLAGRKAELEEPLATLRRLTVDIKASLTVQHVKGYLEDPTARVLVLGYHREALGQVAEDLAAAGYPTAMIRGGMDDAGKERATVAFQTGEARVLCGQIAACGSGIDLSAADAVVFAETVWTPGDNLQAAMRSQRRGKTHPVPVDVLVLEGSIDEAVERVKVRKIRTLEHTYDESEA